jgi:beta-glucanase (GH16 family)
MTLNALIVAMAAQSGLSATNFTVDAPHTRPANAILIWSDEFAGRSLDPRSWSYDTEFNKRGWFNNERQYYSANRRGNLRVENGILTIEARRETLDPAKFPDWGGQIYTSARILSKRAWTYGFFEIRAKLPCARGMWPAIWMLPINMKKWPDDGEIDIMEQVGSDPNQVHATLHTGLFNHVRKTQRGAQRLISTSCTAFHRYQLDWRPESITIGVDDRAMLLVRNDQPGNRGAWPFDAPFRLILNLAVGGDWAGAKGIDDAALPQHLKIDYVRVWQAGDHF